MPLPAFHPGGPYGTPLPTSFARLLPLRSLGRLGPFSHDSLARRLHQRWIPRQHHLRVKDVASMPGLTSTDLLRRQRMEKEAHVWTPDPNSHDTASSGGIFNLEFNQTGSVLAAACEQRSLLLFDPGSRKKFRTIENAHEDCVNCVRFLDDRFFATCSDDCTVALWDLRNLRGRVRSFKGHSNWVKNIEYAPEEHSLVTSGFDGAVYHWDINRYSEEDGADASPGQKLFHTSGLMRMRISPPTEPSGAPRMVMSTMHGFLMVVHDLSLEHLEEDLKNFKPNMYRLLQLSGQRLGNNYIYTPHFHSKRNRIEFIDDFPQGNQAELISSLKIHPQGWVAVTRNISSDENTEWCCVHDIHGGAPDPDADDPILAPATTSSSDHRRRFLRVTPASNSNEEGEAMEGPREPLEGTGLHRLADFLSASFGNPQEQQQQGSRRQISIRVNEDPTSGRRTVQIRATSESEVDSSSGEEEIDEDSAGAEYQVVSDAISRAQEEVELRRRARQIASATRARRRAAALLANASTSGVSVAPGPTRAGEAVVGGAEDEEQDVQRVSNSIYRPLSRRGHLVDVPDTARIHRNQPRLTHYLEESNTGRGFIKEVSFSPDGRILCSPFGFGFRLLAFNEACQDMSVCTPGPGEPARVLHELGTVANCHTSCVLSTAFAPHQFMLVAGSLHGQISWHQPLP